MDRIWLKNYPENIPLEIPHLEQTLLELFDDTCRRFSNRKAFVSFNTALSFQQINRKASYLAAFLQNRLPFQPGQSLIIQLPNLLQFPISLWAGIKAGFVIVPMNPLCTAKEMLYQIKDSGAQAIITLSSSASALESFIHKTDLKVVIVTEPGDLLSFGKKTLINFAFKYIQKRSKSYKKLKYIPFLEAMQSGQALKLQIKDRALDAPLLYQYTGGTTGISKAVVLSHLNILSNIKQCELWMAPSLVRNKEQALVALPLFHIFSLTLNAFVLSLYGSSCILAANARDIKSLIRLLRQYPITVTTGVNTLFKALMSQKGFKSLDFVRLKFSIAGGMSLDEKVKKQWELQTKSPLVEGYGLTEASPVVCCNDLLSGGPGGVGLPFPSTQVRVTNDKGEELKPGEKGELEVKGPQVMSSYYNKPEETKKVLSSSGWLKTGDMAIISKQGFVEIAGRKKDMINVSGFNVFPLEIEAVIQELPEVRDVAVLGVADRKSGEVPKAFVVRKTPGLDKKRILDHCKKNLIYYKQPKHIEFVESIPKNLLGKPLRRLLG